MWRIKDRRTGKYATTAAFTTKARAYDRLISLYDSERLDITPEDLKYLIIIFEERKEASASTSRNDTTT